MTFPLRAFLACTFLALACSAQELRFANLGDLKLTSGDVIKDCRVGYRIVGALNARKDNAILVPTWFCGTSEELLPLAGPGKLLECPGACFVLVDALGDGVSTSPSNSATQPRMAFPRISIRDMVESQRRLLEEELGIHHLKAVVGISMGGMQTFQWMVAYPGFMDRAVPVIGSPRPAAYDLLLWKTMNLAIQRDPAWKGGNYEDNPARDLREGIFSLVLTTPGEVNTLPREKADERLAASLREPGFDANNHIRQSEAMIALDVSGPFGGDMAQAAAAVKAKVLVLVDQTDHTVTPGPALAFARRIRAKVVALNSPHGHLVTYGEAKAVHRALSAFLK